MLFSTSLLGALVGLIADFVLSDDKTRTVSYSPIWIGAGIGAGVGLLTLAIIGIVTYTRRNQEEREVLLGNLQPAGAGGANPNAFYDAPAGQAQGDAGDLEAGDGDDQSEESGSLDAVMMGTG